MYVKNLCRTGYLKRWGTGCNGVAVGADVDVGVGYTAVYVVVRTDIISVVLYVVYYSYCTSTTYAVCTGDVGYVVVFTVEYVVGRTVGRTVVNTVGNVVGLTVVCDVVNVVVRTVVNDVVCTVGRTVACTV